MSNIVVAATIMALIIVFGRPALVVALAIVVTAMFFMGTTILKSLERFEAWRARRLQGK